MQITMTKEEFDGAIKKAEYNGAIEGFVAYRRQIKEAKSEMQSGGWFSRAKYQMNIEMCDKIIKSLNSIISKLKEKQ